MFEGLHFANLKAGYYFLLGLFLVVLLYYSLSSRKKALFEFAEFSSLKQLLFLEKRTVWRYLLLLGCFSLTVFALMQPEKYQNRPLLSEVDKEVLEESWVDNQDQEKVITKRGACDVFFLVDTSQSMEIRDTRTKVSRLEYAKEIIDEVIHKLDGQNVSLYAFTSELTPLVPPTMDYIFTRLLTKNIQINEGDAAGTDLLEALEQMQRKYFSKVNEKQTVLILLTDGGDTYLESLSGDQRERQIKLILDKVESSEQKKIQCFTVGLGTEQGEQVPNLLFEGQPVVSSLDSKLLQEISQKGNGDYYFANAYSAPEIAQSIVSQIKKEQVYIEEELTPDKKLLRSALENQADQQTIIYYYQWPLFLAIMLLGLEILLPSLPLNKEILSDD